VIAPPTVEIVLSAYNGERFLREQIASIVDQTWQDWRLVIRDDASTDATEQVAAEAAAQEPGRITVTRRETNSGSARRSFLELLGASTAPYVMLSDHDDVWRPEKIELTLAAMRALEERHGDVPLLVHTDLTVTDADLRVLEPSMVRAQQLAGHESRLARVLVQNTVTGCTVMVNRRLAELAPDGADDDRLPMHDWWLAVLASAFGAVGFVDRPTVLYRQHGSNVVGARPSRSTHYKVGRLLDREGVVASLRASYLQAEALLDHHGARLAPAQAEVVRAFAALPRSGKAARVATLCRRGFWKNTTARQLGQLLYV